MAQIDDLFPLTAAARQRTLLFLDDNDPKGIVPVDETPDGKLAVVEASVPPAAVRGERKTTTKSTHNRHHLPSFRIPKLAKNQAARPRPGNDIDPSTPDSISGQSETKSPTLHTNLTMNHKRTRPTAMSSAGDQLWEPLPFQPPFVFPTTSENEAEVSQSIPATSVAIRPASIPKSPHYPGRSDLENLYALSSRITGGIHLSDAELMQPTAYDLDSFRLANPGLVSESGNVINPDDDKTLAAVLRAMFQHKPTQAAISLGWTNLKTTMGQTPMATMNLFQALKKSNQALDNVGLWITLYASGLSLITHSIWRHRDAEVHERNHKAQLKQYFLKEMW